MIKVYRPTPIYTFYTSDECSLYKLSEVTKRIQYACYVNVA